MRPRLRFLDDVLVSRILDEARDLLATLGVEVHNAAATELLLAHGARTDERGRVLIPATVVDRALRAAPHAVRLFDALGVQTHELGGDAVYFIFGSAAIHVLDGETGRIRPPTTADYVRYAKLVAGLLHFVSQSTVFIFADVLEGIQDSFRLFLSLLLGEKPIVTKTFSATSFKIMRNLQLKMRGTTKTLQTKPLYLFSYCPTAPLK
jgi:trimethylamine:corrinoid methyltransferase-like protein